MKQPTLALLLVMLAPLVAAQPKALILLKGEAVVESIEKKAWRIETGGDNREGGIMS
jgi:hypothetical protein